MSRLIEVPDSSLTRIMEFLCPFDIENLKKSRKAFRERLEHPLLGLPDEILFGKIVENLHLRDVRALKISSYGPLRKRLKHAGNKYFIDCRPVENRPIRFTIETFCRAIRQCPSPPFGPHSSARITGCILPCEDDDQGPELLPSERSQSFPQVKLLNLEHASMDITTLEDLLGLFPSVEALEMSGFDLRLPSPNPGVPPVPPFYLSKKYENVTRIEWNDSDGFLRLDGFGFDKFPNLRELSLDRCILSCTREFWNGIWAFEFGQPENTTRRPTCMLSYCESGLTHVSLVDVKAVVDFIPGAEQMPHRHFDISGKPFQDLVRTTPTLESFRSHLSPRRMDRLVNHANYPGDAKSKVKFISSREEEREKEEREEEEEERLEWNLYDEEDDETDEENDELDEEDGYEEHEIDITGFERRVVMLQVDGKLIMRN